MKHSILMLVVAALVASVPASAAIETQLFLDANGTTATITVNTGNVVLCAGTCGGLTITSTGDHKQLVVLGTLGSFEINTTGRGDLSTVEPTLQNLNQIQARSVGGAGYLIAEYTDTGYSTMGTAFLLSASIVNDTQISGSTTDFAAYVSSANAIPAGDLIGGFNDLTGNSQATSNTFANPNGSSGSLTSRTRIDFTGEGTVQANFTIANGIPEPTSVVLFSSLLIATGAIARRRKMA